MLNDQTLGGATRLYTWAKHNAGTSYCCVVDVAGGSVITACRGRWSTEDTYEIHDAPPLADRCGGCVAVLA